MTLSPANITGKGIEDSMLTSDFDGKKGRLS